jgi:hypothetical protein
MNNLLKIIVIILTSLPSFAQISNKSITWHGKIMGEYLPKLHSDWNTTSIGGLISFQFKNSDHFFTSAIGKINFIPTAGENNVDFSAIRNASLSLSFDPLLNHIYDFIISFGASYTEGKVIDATYNYLNIFSQLKYEYDINKKTSIFLDVNSIFDIKNNLFTPTLKVGFTANFIIISFELLQYINWDNKKLRNHNFFSVPYINHHQ